jgi:glucose-6-phosphate isomerase
MTSTDTSNELWDRFCRTRVAHAALGFSMDVSRAQFTDNNLAPLLLKMTAAMTAMRELEAGAIANPDENRMVGHYWLRTPDLAPDAAITRAITDELARIEQFADAVHAGEMRSDAGPFTHLLLIGIGGSALGPQFVSDALGNTDDRMQLRFLDNTDPDGIDRVLAELKPHLATTMVCVVSKSGSTPEPRNGMLETRAVFRQAGLDFARHAVAITMDGSTLHALATEERWRETFAMWDWVGGRTSIMSAVGLLPLRLQGVDVRAMLDGASQMDEWTRTGDLKHNPAAMLAMLWHVLGEGAGHKDMVILPYKDRLLLFSRYLQQLVMESLGKEFDRAGNPVHQGIAVYGNKGSTDQHAYVQQLREGVHNFFVTFINVLEDRKGDSIEVEPGVTCGDYLRSFSQGTREALYEMGRNSITITIKALDARRIGALIALYDRAVGLYAELIDINAYHQPGVEAGKKAAAGVLALQGKVLRFAQSMNEPQTAASIAGAVGESEQVEAVYMILEHLAANPGRGVQQSHGGLPNEATFQAG